MVWKHYNKKGQNKMKDQCMLSKAQRHEMLCINRQNGDKLAQAVDILTDIRNMLRRTVAQDCNIVRKPRRLFLLFAEQSLPPGVGLLDTPRCKRLLPLRVRGSYP